MKRVDGFQCENCQVIHNTAQEATDCEKSHTDRIAGAKLMGGSFKSPEGTWGMGRQHRLMYPVSVSIRFSNEHGDFARYVLEHVGYRGV